MITTVLASKRAKPQSSVVDKDLQIITVIDTHVTVNNNGNLSYATPDAPSRC